MRFNFYLSSKAWQLNLISLFLLFGSVFLFPLGILALKLGLLVWFLFNIAYMNTISLFIEDNIPSTDKPKRKAFSFALIMQCILFGVLTFLCIGPERVLDSNSYVLLFGLPIGFLGLYSYFYVIKILLIAENKGAVEFGDVLIEYFKIGFKFLNIYSIQKRAVNCLGKN